MKFGAVLFFLCLYVFIWGVQMYVREYRSCIWIGIGRNGIARGMRKLEWHISKFGFCNGISSTSENYNGINPINPLLY
jgi:hypothetical protein